MMIKVKTDRRVKIITTLLVIAFVALGTWVYMRSSGTFLPAWFTIVGAALLLLVVISIPKGVVITKEMIEIHCILELTCINFKEIKNVKILQKRDLNPCVPMAGVFGFFGYFGYYFSFKRNHMFKIYAKAWKNLVLIETNSKKMFVIAVDSPEEFVKSISR